MSVEIVDVKPEDLAAFFRTSVAWWGEVPDAGLDVVRDVIDRALFARVDGVDAGTAATIDFTLTMPGGRRVPMDGVTWVVVSPVSRRRGALRAMMDDVLEHARVRDVPVLGLGASESLIYRRFGYGVSSHIGSATIDTAHAALRAPFTDPGHIRLQPLDGAIPVWIDVERRQAAARVGAVDRSEASWRRLTASADKPRGAMSALQIAVHVDASGVVDGFVNYRVEHRWPGEVADGVIHVRELAAVNLDAHVSLWQHVLTMDLMEHLSAERYWLDDPIQHLLADGRRMNVRPRDDLHLRVADVVTMLQSRRYQREDALVVEVYDGAAPDIAGRYLVEGGLDGASASRTAAAADILLDAPSLGSLMLGDVSAAALHAAGLIEEVRDGAVQRASAMFSWSPRPWLNYMF